MINLFRFILRNSAFFLFLLFEVFALYLVVNYNQSQRTIFLNSSNRISGTMLEKNDQLRDYFNLTKINEKLNEENSLLLNKIGDLQARVGTVSKSSFLFRDAKVISNRIDGRYNRFLINQGREENVVKGMGVMSEQHPVGIVYQVSDHYASVISLLNINLNLSVRIQDKSYFGTLNWQPLNIRESILYHVPAYADVTVGDTVVTSGYSNIFPENLPVGVVSNVSTPTGTNSHEINVQLFADISRLNYVQLIDNIDRTQIDSLKIDSES